MNAWMRADAGMPLDLDGPADVVFERFEEAWLDIPVIARFEQIASRYSARPAVSDGTRTVCYAELRSRALALAERIVARCPPGRPVGILLPQDASFPVAALACFAASRAFVPIDLKHPQARVDAIVRDGELGGVVAQEDTQAWHRFPAELRIAFSWNELDGEPHTPPCETTCVDDPAVILYTSGSTGQPKGICNNQRAILQRVCEATNSCHIHPADNLLLLSSPGTIAGQREMFAALLNGATLHVTDPQVDGVHRVLDTMIKERITLCYAVPSLLRVLLRLPGARLAFAHMRVVRVGGDVTLSSDLALFRDITPASCRFFASFSSTETPAVFQWFVPADWKATGPRVAIGHARPGIDFKVVSEDGMPVAPGEIGELVVRSRYLALGQWHAGRMVAGPFQADPSHEKLRVFYTGDLVRQGADGLWELFGRKDRQIKIRGTRIDAGEVEAALRACPGVTDVAVIARRQGEETVALAAFVAFERGISDCSDTRPEPMQRTLKQALQQRVPAYMHPADIRVLDALPQLSGFKADIAALERLDRQLLEQASQQRAAPNVIPHEYEGSRSSDATAMRDPVAEAVRHAWSNVLGAKSFATNQPWDEADGNSLKAIELWFYIEQRLGLKLPLDAVAENATPRDLIAAIRMHLHTSARAKESDASDVPVVFLFPAIQDDDPPLARFRAAFGKQVRFKLIDYPPWRATLADGGSLSSIVDAVLARIDAEPPCESYRVAGYSFGGVIAFEVARRLVAAGRRVEFLGLLDTRRWDLTVRDQTNFHRFLEELPNWRIDWLKMVIAWLIQRGHFGVLDAWERLLMHKPSRFAFWLKRRITRELRYQALLQWRPEMLAVPTELYLSNDRWPGEPEDYGWGDICQPLRQVPVGGDHATVIQSPQRERLCSAFLAAIHMNARRTSAQTG